MFTSKPQDPTTSVHAPSSQADSPQNKLKTLHNLNLITAVLAALVFFATTLPVRSEHLVPLSGDFLSEPAAMTQIAPTRRLIVNHTLSLNISDWAMHHEISVDDIALDFVPSIDVSAAFLDAGSLFDPYEIGGAGIRFQTQATADPFTAPGNAASRTTVSRNTDHLMPWSDLGLEHEFSMAREDSQVRTGNGWKLVEVVQHIMWN